MFVVAPLQKRLVTVLQIKFVSKEALFERDKIYQHAIVIHSKVVSLSNPNSTPCISVRFLSPRLSHTYFNCRIVFAGSGGSDIGVQFCVYVPLGVDKKSFCPRQFWEEWHMAVIVKRSFKHEPKPSSNVARKQWPSESLR